MYFLYLKTREFIEWLPMGNGTRIEARLLLKYFFVDLNLEPCKLFIKVKFKFTFKFKFYFLINLSKN